MSTATPDGGISVVVVGGRVLTIFLV